MADFGLSAVFGRKPKVAKYKPISAQTEQTKAIEGNIAAFPDIAKLGDLYSSNELAQLEKILPGYGDQLTAGRATTDALFKQATPLLAGEIPQDVQDAIQRSSAYQALRGGYQGSPMANALTARDLGLTSLDLQGKGAQLAGQGVNSMQAWDALARKDIMEPGSQLFTPQQQYAITSAEKARQYQAIQNSYNVQAQPNPVAKGAFDSVMQVLGEVLSIYGGGSGYKPQAYGGGAQGVSFNQGYGSSDNPGFFNPGYSADVQAYG